MSRSRLPLLVLAAILSSRLEAAWAPGRRAGVALGPPRARFLAAASAAAVEEAELGPRDRRAAVEEATPAPAAAAATAGAEAAATLAAAGAAAAAAASGEGGLFPAISYQGIAASLPSVPPCPSKAVKAASSASWTQLRSPRPSSRSLSMTRATASRPRHRPTLAEGSSFSRRAPERPSTTASAPLTGEARARLAQAPAAAALALESSPPCLIRTFTAVPTRSVPTPR
mmetsp:Transcript_8655/g.15904  ORF Transcript_8655/g.15904 Transcript_8655/m.15904 type:complete len:228 (-) Transcript_8655:210-893(-)